MEKPTVFLDIDYTILDMEKAKDEISKIIEAVYGEGTSEPFWEIYEEVKEDLGTVDVKEIGMRFAKKVGSEDLASAVGAFLDLDFNSFLYPQAKELIDFLSVNSRLIIFTYGHELFQGQKIKNLGLDKVAEKLVITPVSKHEAVVDLLEGESSPYFMLDDNDLLLKEAKKIRNDLHTVWLKLNSRLSQADSIGADFEATSINQALKYLKKMFEAVKVEKGKVH